MTLSDQSMPILEKSDYVQLSNFRYQLRHFLRHSENICRINGLTPLQYQLLLHVMGAPGKDWLSIGELAERLQAHHHGVVALIDRCEKLGLVERRTMQDDRRKVAIHLLPKGLQLLNRLALQHQQERQTLQDAFALPRGGTAAADSDGKYQAPILPA